MYSSKAILLSVALLVSGNTTAEFSYDYIEGGYSYWGLKNSTTSWHYDGLKIKVSKGISDNIHLSASHMDMSRETNNSTHNGKFKEIGIGINYPIQQETDFIFDFGHNRYTSNYSSASTNINSKTSVNRYDVAIRHHLESDLEVIGRAHKTSNEFTGIGGGMIKDINENVSIELFLNRIKRSGSSTDWTDVFLGLRHYY